MKRRRFALVTLTLALAGCQTTSTRIEERATAFAALDPSAQQKIRRGAVEPGYTPDMVYMALGKPTRTTSTATGDVVWSYHQPPTPAYNETVQTGFVRRVVYDPVKRADDVIVEPIDAKAFPHLVPHTLRITFHADRVAGIERLEGIR